MKRLFIYIIACYALASCTQEKDYFKAINESPVLTISDDDQEYTDTTIYRRVKLRTYEAFAYSISEKCDISHDVNGISVEISDSIRITADSAGLFDAFITAEDEFGETSYVKLSYEVYENERPKASATASQKSGGFSPYEIYIDASNSVDDDAIVKYQFTVGNNYSAESDLPIISYICEEPGQKEITVRVVDSDGATSDMLKFTINVE